MNSRFDEYLMEERRKNIQRDMEQIHLEEKFSKRKIYRPNLFSHSMETLGKWLILRGETLVKRYETPKKKCQHINQNSYAH